MKLSYAKRFFATLLIVTMLFTAVPFQAFALENGDVVNTDETTTIPPSHNISIIATNS